MALYDLNLFGGSESNLNWYKLLNTSRLSEWLCDVLSCQTFMAHNMMENLSCHQFGGTFWIGSGTATQYITGASKDLWHLGHWSVCTLLSHSGCKLHVIFGYHPCQNYCFCLHSIYAQHCWHFDLINWLLCLRSTFSANLAQSIQEWTPQGNKVLLFANMNGNIQLQEISTFTASCDLLESILSQHSTLPPLETFK